MDLEIQKKYEKTRHNAGFIILNSILGDVSWNKSSKANAFYFWDKGGAQEVEYLKPQTFMNNSGRAVSYAQKNHDLEAENIVVVYDDIDLPFGKIKISYDRGDGGHNGVKSIMDHLGSQSFIRIRVGVSILDENEILRKPDVLSKFSKKEFELLEKDISSTVKEIIEMISKEGKDSAMNKFNTN